MAEKQITDGEALALSATTKNGVLLPTDDGTDWDLAVWRSLEKLARLLAVLFRLTEDDGGALLYYISGGRFLDGDTARNLSAAAGQGPLTDAATNYVYITAAGTVTVNTTGFPSPSATPHIPVCAVSCAAGDFAYSDVDMSYLGRSLMQLCDGLTAAQRNKLIYHDGVEASTAGVGTPNVLTAAETNRTITNQGAGAKCYNTLPAPASGLRFRFECESAHGIRVTADGSGRIRVGSLISALAGYWETTTVGAVLELMAVDGNYWVAVSCTGDWTDGTNYARYGLPFLADVADHCPYAAISAGAEAGDVIDITIQAKDASGNSLAAYVLMDVWIALTDWGPPSDTSHGVGSATTGQTIQTVLANAHVRVMTDVNGTAVIPLGLVGAGTRYVMAAIKGQVYSSGAVNFAA